MWRMEGREEEQEGCQVARDGGVAGKKEEEAKAAVAKAAAKKGVVVWGGAAWAVAAWAAVARAEVVWELGARG